MNDRYTKTVLTVIAGALIYLCVIFTPLPGVSAQSPSKVPGVSSGPTDVVIVGWRAPDNAAFPVAIHNQVRVSAKEPLQIRGSVTTERSASGIADRVVVVGWEENASKDRPTPLHPINSNKATGIPVRSLP